jgi:hypothetical protein
MPPLIAPLINAPTNCSSFIGQFRPQPSLAESGDFHPAPHLVVPPRLPLFPHAERDAKRSCCCSSPPSLHPHRSHRPPLLWPPRPSSQRRLTSCTTRSRRCRDLRWLRGRILMRDNPTAVVASTGDGDGVRNLYNLTCMILVICTISRVIVMSVIYDFQGLPHASMDRGICVYAS